MVTLSGTNNIDIKKIDLGNNKGNKNQSKNGERKIGLMENIRQNKNAGAKDARKLKGNGLKKFGSDK